MINKKICIQLSKFAIFLSMACSISGTVYAENGDFIASGCITVNAHAIFTDALQNYFVNGDWVDGHVSVEIIQVSDSTVKFSATLFMGNTAESRGFGFQSFRSENYEMFSDLMCQQLPY